MNYRNRLLLLLALVMLLIGHLSASAQDKAEWMSQLPDDVFVSQLSIPGAHDAGTGHGTAGDSFARTQDKTLTEMWDSGVRAFDLRPSVDGDRLRIYHGILSTDLYFDDALSTLCGLLDSYPSETCIVVMRHEDDHDSGSSSWNTMMKALLTAKPTKVHTVNFNPMAKLGDVRGKMIILSRDAYDTRPVGGFITGWGHSADFSSQKSGRIRGVGTTGQLYVQDYYDVSASGATATKTASVNRLLQFSTEENTDPATWVINHTSGYTTTFFGIATQDGYRDNAKTQNTAVIDYLKDHSGATGILVMDYAATDRSGHYDVMGQTLTDALIANNLTDGPNTDYFRALAAIDNGTVYRVFTEVDGTRFYLTADGYLSSEVSQGGVFTFSRVKGQAYAYGFNLQNAYFSNPPVEGNPTLNNGHIATNTQKRNTWEAQVFFLNAEGKYAVRATNAAGGTSGWAVNADTYWVVNSGTDAPKAEYGTAATYVWQLEEYDELTAIAPLPAQGRRSSNLVFDAAGRRRAQPSRGLNIINGKAVVGR